MVGKNGLIVLKQLSDLLTQDKYRILEEHEILEGIETEYISGQYLPLILKELVDNGCIILKYSQDQTYCLTITSKAYVVLDDEEANASEESADSAEKRKLFKSKQKISVSEHDIEVIADKVASKIQKRTEARFSGWKMFWIIFAACFSAGLILLILSNF